MTYKFITQYTETTTPSATDNVLLDIGSGVYKYAQLSKLLSVIPFTTSGKIETTNTSADSIKTAGGINASGTVSASALQVNGSIVSEIANVTTLNATAIKLGAVLSSDEKWSGITTSGTAGATLAVGDICYLASSGKWLLVDGILDGTDTGFSKQLGFCILAGNDTQATEMLLYGKIRSAKLPTLTVGSPVYLADTAGTVVVAQPSTTNFAIRIVGYALTEEDLMFNPSNDWIVKL